MADCDGKTASFLGLPHTEASSDDVFDKNFSDYILKIDISAPGLQNISVVDLPGVAHSMSSSCKKQWRYLTLVTDATAAQTEEEIEMLKARMSEYIASPWSVIV